MRNLVWFACAVLLACAPSPDAAMSLNTIDRAVHRAHPDVTTGIARSIGVPDEDGLIGRNRSGGRLYSPRFQYGAGRAWRHSLASGARDDASRARSAVIAGFGALLEDGRFASSWPGTERPVGPSETASAAAFFLSDACPALAAAGDGSRQDDVILALERLQRDAPLLRCADDQAPNRLLLNALAFHACGTHVARPDLAGEAELFVLAALAFTSDTGVIREAGGSDTSYQAVSLNAMSDLIALGYRGMGADALDRAHAHGAGWLADRIGADGALDSTDNTRTCAGETFARRPKDVDLREVFTALARAEAMGRVEGDTVRRYAGWLRGRPSAC